MTTPATSNEDEQRRRAKKKDENFTWTNFTAAELDRYATSIPFFDADGMRFRLAAFLLFEIDGKLEQGSLMSCLARCSRHNLRENNFSSLTKLQREAVAAFLQWCLLFPKYEAYVDDIAKAIDSEWKSDLR